MCREARRLRASREGIERPGLQARSGSRDVTDPSPGTNIRASQREAFFALLRSKPPVRMLQGMSPDNRASLWTVGCLTNRSGVLAATWTSKVSACTHRRFIAVVNKVPIPRPAQFLGCVRPAAVSALVCGRAAVAAAGLRTFVRRNARMKNRFRSVAQSAST